MGNEILAVPRAPFDTENPWAVPAVCRPVSLVRATDGAAPRLATSVAVWYDDAYLTVLFSLADDAIRATHLQHDAPLYEEDVVEVFVAPASPVRYFEFEVNPLGTLFDARVDSPDGVRATMDVQRHWDCDGLLAAVRKAMRHESDISLDIVLRIPFAGIEAAPAAGDEWQANFFRIDRHDAFSDEFTAWQPTMTTPADFHVVAAFGTLRFT